MENKNYKTVAEILKDCPEGMELYSPMCGECTFTNVYNGIIHVKKGDDFILTFYEKGQYYENGECLLFPSKECRDWNNFEKPFEREDVIVSQTGNIAIYSHCKTNSYGNKVVYYQCLLYSYGEIKIANDCGIGCIKDCRYATKEEKERLYKALEKEGYRYNHTTKNVEKIQKKFDISTLKPFDKILVRDSLSQEWTIDLYSHFCKNKYKNKYSTASGAWYMCIPYEGNEYLVGTTNEPNDFFVTWE